MRSAFAASVRRERKARHWTFAELAQEAGVSKTTALNAEHGKKGPSLETAALIARAFGMKVGALVDGGQEAGT